MRKPLIEFLVWFVTIAVMAALAVWVLTVPVGCDEVPPEVKLAAGVEWVCVQAEPTLPDYVPPSEYTRGSLDAWQFESADGGPSGYWSAGWFAWRFRPIAADGEPVYFRGFAPCVRPGSIEHWDIGDGSNPTAGGPGDLWPDHGAVRLVPMGAASWAEVSLGLTAPGGSLGDDVVNTGANARIWCRGTRLAACHAVARWADFHPGDQADLADVLYYSWQGRSDCRGWNQTAPADGPNEPPPAPPEAPPEAPPWAQNPPYEPIAPVEGLQVLSCRWGQMGPSGFEARGHIIGRDPVFFAPDGDPNLDTWPTGWRPPAWAEPVQLSAFLTDPDRVALVVQYTGATPPPPAGDEIVAVVGSHNWQRWIYAAEVRLVVTASAGGLLHLMSGPIVPIGCRAADGYCHTSGTAGGAVLLPVTAPGTVEIRPGFPVVGDLTGDHLVDVADLVAFCGVWQNRSYLPADLNHDGAVDLADWAILRGAL